MYERIVVPLDGSELAEAALEYVRHLAARSGAQVILLHACRPEVERMHRVYLQHTAGILRSWLEETRSEAPAVDSAVLLGHPAEEILKYVGENNISLIAMTTHGRSGIQRWAMGSVADKVARHSAVPVWLARSDVPQEIIRGEWPERRILVLLDGSKRAERALPYVTGHAKITGAEVTLLRVFGYPPLFADYATGLRSNWAEHIEQLTANEAEECARYLAGPERRLRDAGLQVRSEALFGNAWDEIIGYIERDGFNLVALTSHGRSGIARWTLGSVAERVLQRCPVPLLLVRAR